MDMYKILLLLHITAGSLALLSGPVAMLKQDGGIIHRRSGFIFFASMMFVAFSGISMAAIHPSIFLVMIGIFSFYLSFTGYRALKLKRLHRGDKPKSIDWLVLGLCLLCVIGMWSEGIYLLINQENMGIVLLVFGVILSIRLKADYTRFTVPYSDKKVWLYTHIGNMIGAYIAAFTAFVVQNIHFSPGFVVWLAPSLVFVPFMRITLNKFKKGKTIPALEKAE